MAGNRRQSDHWTKKAKAAGFPARSVYKLEEIQRRERMLPRKGRVVDLGCCPGSWSQYLRRISGNKLVLVGVDLTDTPDYPGTFLQGSALTIETARITEALGGPNANLVMSDMAQNTEGNRFTDHIRQVELARSALRIARGVLQPGGDFIVKVFDGAEAPDFVREVRVHFGRVRRLKPEATRRESVEFFLIGRGFRVGSREEIQTVVPS
ncbi:MAG: 23S rRNA (uridine2552-2'-O)-methyltransferase [Myxococcota bacterium]|jgi:23S rRNA (uridine2552-2'-O)-methyltransferase